ncbi:3-dehydrosphinganine reductase TSC10A-like isoform X2 [Papaver somniferum]|uniref:3-dehydrosphinganine reductase TSC10A-like isoform X2 n=1 Tax=Papaver somniferum TaxID=3469 RepID=UPI000E6F4BB1|nr:3-dehydrosphinganine reductase TSC10A-like isoform X2 [Papaver somniferum]
MATIPILIVIFLLIMSLYLTLLLRPKPIKIPVKNRHVFITGGSSGIGLSLAHQAASEGARVTILARDPNKLEQARDSIHLSTGVNVNIAIVDVRDFETLKAVMDEADPIDVLVCNQGVYIGGELEFQKMENVKMMVDVNLMGTLNLIKAALPRMKNNRKTRGPASIALMSSQAGQCEFYGYTTYSATKFGLRGLGEALQMELISDDIHVSLIFPPDTATPGLIEEKKRRPRVMRKIAACSSPMTADEVARKTLDGIKSGTFLVSCNFLGFLMCLGAADLAPQRSILSAFAEIFAAGFIRFYAVAFLWRFYEMASRCNTNSSHKRADGIMKNSSN